MYKKILLMLSLSLITFSGSAKQIDKTETSENVF